MKPETIKELRYKVCEAVGEVLTDYYHQNDGDNQKHICASEDITQAALEALGFDALLEERDKLREERDRLRKAIEDAVNDINNTVMEMGAKA